MAGPALDRRTITPGPSSMKAWRPIFRAHPIVLRLVQLKRGDQLLQLVLRELTQVTLWQIGPAALKSHPALTGKLGPRFGTRNRGPPDHRSVIGGSPAAATMRRRVSK